MTEASRRDAGCLEYFWGEDLETPNTFRFFECWASQELFDAQIAGSAKEIKGAIKQVAGKAVGDAQLEADGKADKIEGKIQNAIGGLKDTLRGK